MGDLLNLVDGASERLLIGCVLRAGIDAFAEVSDRIRLDDFGVQRHREVWAAIERVAREVGPGLNAVAEDLIRCGRLEAIGGLAELVDLDSEAIPGLRVDGLADTLRSKSRRRRAVGLTEKIGNAIELDTLPAAELQALIGELRDLASGSDVQREGAAIDLVSAAELYRGSVTQLRVLFENLLWDGLTMCVARPKAGKSWLTLQLAVDVAGGQTVPGIRHVETGPVLYLALEEPQARTMARLRKLAAPGTWASNLHFVYDLLPLMGGGAEQLAALVTQLQPRLVVVDTLTAVIKGGGKRDSDVFRSQYAEVSKLRKLAEEFKIALIVVHHIRKGVSDGAIESIAGTGGIAAAIDTVWALKRKPEGEATLEVLGREIEERTLALRFDNDEPFGWRVLGDDAIQLLNGERRELLSLLREDGGLTPAQIAAELGKSRPAVRMLLKRMRDDGQVRKDGSKYLDLSHS